MMSYDQRNDAVLLAHRWINRLANGFMITPSGFDVPVPPIFPAFDVFRLISLGNFQHYPQQNQMDDGRARHCDLVCSRKRTLAMERFKIQRFMSSKWKSVMSTSLQEMLTCVLSIKLTQCGQTSRAMIDGINKDLLFCGMKYMSCQYFVYTQS